MKFTAENDKERMKFVDFWSKYVMEHEDKEWSRQQNLVINSCLRSTKMTKEEFLSMKNELETKARKSLI